MAEGWRKVVLHIEGNRVYQELGRQSKKQRRTIHSISLGQWVNYPVGTTDPVIAGRRGTIYT